MYLRSQVCLGIMLCLLALLPGYPGGIAQTMSSMPGIGSGTTDLEKLFGGKTSVAPLGDLFFDGPVNPDDYIVGPGDRLLLVFWKPTFMEYPVTVGGEGDVLVPYVGIVPVADQTLSTARQRILDAVKAALRVGEVTVSLVEPRQFRVNVTGLVERPGTYVVPAIARVSDAIVMAGGLQRKPAAGLHGLDSTVIASQRRIELRNGDGEFTGHADMLLFRRGGDINANPRLLDGQTVHVAYPAAGWMQVGAFGAVYDGGLFEYVPGDRLLDVLRLAGGLTDAADPSGIVIVSRDGSRTAIDLTGSDGAARLSHPLQAGDRIHIAGIPDTSRLGSVAVTGEVAKPGGYPIITGETTLRELLQAANGLLPTAAANSARLIRNAANDRAARERERVLIGPDRPIAANQVLDIDRELAAEFSRWDYGTVVVDVTRALNPGSEAGSLKLHDGDVLEIPRLPLGVRVLGRVNKAGEVAWEPDRGLNHYLGQAGGTNRGGWKGQTMLIKARNGSLVRYQPGLSVDPGDVIFVPSKPVATTWTQIKDFAAVAAQVATLVLVSQNIGKK